MDLHNSISGALIFFWTSTIRFQELLNYLRISKIIVLFQRALKYFVPPQFNFMTSNNAGNIKRTKDGKTLGKTTPGITKGQMGEITFDKTTLRIWKGRMSGERGKNF